MMKTYIKLWDILHGSKIDENGVLKQNEITWIGIVGHFENDEEAYFWGFGWNKKIGEYTQLIKPNNLISLEKNKTRKFTFTPFKLILKDKEEVKIITKELYKL